MHISTSATSAISVILLSFLGGSNTVHAELYEDAFGVTNYGIQCQNRVYPKHSIYAAAKNYCDIIKKIPSFGERYSADLGFQTRFYYYFNSKTDINKILKSSHHIVPILENGELYPLGSRKKSAGQMDKRDPGPDRLVIDVNCDIVGAFTDFDYTPHKIENKIEECRVLKSSSDPFSAWVRSPERSPQRSPPRSREQSPERLPESFSGRTIYQSAELLPVLSRQQSSPRSREQSLERLPESFSGRTIYQSAELLPALSRQQSRHNSAERFTETSLAES